MVNGVKRRKNIYIFIIYFIFNISFSFQAIKKYDIYMNINRNDLDNFYFTDEEFNKFESPCNKWIPSIFNPILLTPKINIDGIPMKEKLDLSIPIFLSSNSISTTLFKDVKFLDYKFYAAKDNLAKKVFKCYFGLSSGLCNYKEIDKENINLNNLNKDKEKRIFSFDKWTINNNSIQSVFYLGDIHDNFTSKNGIIGSCGNIPGGLSWGCLFDEISFNNITFSLKNENGTLYNSYFSNEIYSLVLPEFLKDEFEKKLKNICEYKAEIPALACKNFFIFTNKYINLILRNENMTITGELDNENRFNIEDINRKDNIRIMFKDIKYIILPLIIFKNFHIQFNGENNIINFFTDDNSILQVKEVKNDNNDSSSVLKIFIIIFMIILILVLLYVIFYLIKKKRCLNMERTINKFNKLEEEEDFHNMNENRVF